MTQTHYARHLSTEERAWDVPAHYLSADTCRYTHVMLVPLWVGGIGDYTTAPTDALPLAVGIMLRDPEDEHDVPGVTCDFCGGTANAMDEQGSVYCLRCLLPGGEQYGILPTSRITFVPTPEEG